MELRKISGNPFPRQDILHVLQENENDYLFNQFLTLEGSCNDRDSTEVLKKSIKAVVKRLNNSGFDFHFLGSAPNDSFEFHREAYGSAHGPGKLILTFVGFSLICVWSQLG